MLDETNKSLALLQQQQKIKQLQQAKQKYLYTKYRKIFKYAIYGIFIIALLFFPIFTATVIGHWIKDFFGTIYNILNQTVR